MVHKQEKKQDTQTTEQFLFKPTKLHLCNQYCIIRKAKHELNGERIKRVLEVLHYV